MTRKKIFSDITSAVPLTTSAFRDVNEYYYYYYYYAYVVVAEHILEKILPLVNDGENISMLLSMD